MSDIQNPQAVMSNSRIILVTGLYTDYYCHCHPYSYHKSRRQYGHWIWTRPTSGWEGPHRLPRREERYWREGGWVSPSRYPSNRRIHSLTLACKGETPLRRSFKCQICRTRRNQYQHHTFRTRHYRLHFWEARRPRQQCRNFQYGQGPKCYDDRCCPHSRNDGNKPLRSDRDYESLHPSPSQIHNGCTRHIECIDGYGIECPSSKPRVFCACCGLQHLEGGCKLLYNSVSTWIKRWRV